MAFLIIQLTFLTSPTFWESHCTFNFIFPASCTHFTGAHCLSSQAFLWNLGGNLHNPTALAFCMPKQPAAHRQGLLQLKQYPGSLGSWLQWPLSAWHSSVKWIPGNQFPRWSFLSSRPRIFCSQMKVLHIFTLSSAMGEVLLIFEVASGHLSSCPYSKYVVISSQSYVALTFHVVLFWPNLKIFKSSCSAFCFPFLL